MSVRKYMCAPKHVESFNEVRIARKARERIVMVSRAVVVVVMILRLGFVVIGPTR